MIRMSNINTDQAFRGKAIPALSAKRRDPRTFVYRVLILIAFLFLVTALSPSGSARASFTAPESQVSGAGGAVELDDPSDPKAGYRAGPDTPDEP